MTPIRSMFPLLGILMMFWGVAAGQDPRKDDDRPAARIAPWLKKMDKDVTCLRIDGAGHGVYGQHKRQTEPAMEKFFARTLKRNGTEDG